jgi:hypothetical protein
MKALFYQWDDGICVNARKPLTVLLVERMPGLMRSMLGAWRRGPAWVRIGQGARHHLKNIASDLTRSFVTGFWSQKGVGASRSGKDAAVRIPVDGRCGVG